MTDGKFMESVRYDIHRLNETFTKHTEQDDKRFEEMEHGHIRMETKIDKIVDTQTKIQVDLAKVSTKLVSIIGVAGIVVGLAGPLVVKLLINFLGI